MLQRGVCSDVPKQRSWVTLSFKASEMSILGVRVRVGLGLGRPLITTETKLNFASQKACWQAQSSGRGQRRCETT